MPEFQLGSPRPGDRETNSRNVEAVSENVGVEGATVDADPTSGDNLVRPRPVAAASFSGNENPLSEPLIPRERDIEQGGGEEEEEDNEAFNEILNLLWTRDLQVTKQNICRVALESWGEKDKLFTDRIDRKRKQSSGLQNEVYNLIGFYSVFQGVLLTAVAQSSLLHCNNTWTATLLSSLASFVTVVGIILKLKAIKDLENTIASEELTRRTLVKWQLRLRESGKKFDFKEELQAEAKKEDAKTAWPLNATFLAVTVVHILFSVAFVVSIRQILCNPGHNLLP